MRSDTMINLIIALSLFLSLVGALIWLLSQAKESGENKQKVKYTEKAIENVKKAKDAIARLTDDLRRKLRDKYRPK